jgi:hypothetical protein
VDEVSEQRRQTQVLSAEAAATGVLREGLGEEAFTGAAGTGDQDAGFRALGPVDFPDWDHRE